MKTGNGDGKRKSSFLPSDTLHRIIRKQILSDGPITFEAFMNKGLYYPELGYYMTPNARIGLEGDFYTSSHLHPIFSWLLAVQLDELKGITKDTEEFVILEIGAGRGYFANGVIDFIKNRLEWKDNWRYIIVEKNPHTAINQKKRLDAYKDRVVWKTSLEEVERFSGCVVANEVLDAFPVHQVVMSDQFQEVYVESNKGRFTEVYGDLSRPQLSTYIKRYDFPNIKGYRTEINLRIFEYLKRLHHKLLEGFIISIDYGYSASEYYSEERYQGTLLCYSKHMTNENPYINIGNQDMTAHVNFTSLRDWGNELGLRTLGYCPQGTFLASLGIDKIISKELEIDPHFHKELLKIKNLLFDMGESHQVMIQYQGERNFPTLKGFMLKNRMNRL